MTITRGRRRCAASMLIAAAASVGLAACGSSSSSSSGSSGSSSGDVVIGASIPITGTLAGFGAFEKWGYEHAVNQVNATGGLDVGGHKRHVKLILLDDKTDPNTTSNNVQQLITGDHVDALLGSCTPVLVTAGAIVADRSRVPMVTGCAPLEAFKSVKKWNYVWDIFFDEPDLAAAPFGTLKALHAITNHKVAILHDNGPDGQGLGKAWPLVARANGYTVVMNAQYSTEATDFSSLVAQAKASGADIVFVDSVTPQAVSIRKQMVSAGFTPKVLVIEKGGEPQQFAQALGSQANGVMVGGYWDPTFPYPGASTLRQQFEQQTGQTWSQHIADSNAAAQILLDAISRAGTTDKAKVNAAIAKTDATYVVGPVHFDASHTSKLPLVEDQWQNGKSVVVFSSFPNIKPNGKFLFPLP
jgi:branched-chain amino acid transport system substrate-binding protein